MERSTTDVVGGALLAENAGAALEEIEQVSNQIATLVQNISASARQQVTVAGNISRNMQVLREISTQTADGTSASSQSIGKLSDLASQLRKAASGFRLPEPVAPRPREVKPAPGDKAGAGAAAAKPGIPPRPGPAATAAAKPGVPARPVVPAKPGADVKVAPDALAGGEAELEPGAPAKPADDAAARRKVSGTKA